MATIPSGTKFLGVDPAFTDLTEKKGTKVDRKSEYFTLEDITATIGAGSQGPQGVQGPAGPPGPVGPAGLEWRGAWNTNTSYAVDDAVGFNGSSWFCISAVTGTGNSNPEIATTKWALLASQGAQGIQGVQGPTGPQGAGATQTLQQTIELGSTVSNSSQTVQIIPQFINIKKNDDSNFVSLFPSNVSFGKTSGAVALQCPSSIVGGNKTITLPDASGTVALQNYKSYVAQIIPESSSVITTNVLENTLGTTVTVSWVSGKINIVLGSELITLTNPYLSASNYLQNSIYHVITPSLLGFDTIELASYKVSGTPAVGWSYGGRINFELRLYN